VPSTYERLLGNLAINNLQTKVKALNIGVGESEHELLFTSGEDCTNHVVAQSEKTERTIAVPIRTLDSVVAGESPTVMKMDIEGFETPALKGATAVLGNPSLHSVLMELNGSGLRYGYQDDWIVSHMQGFGFSTFEYEPFTRELVPVATRSGESKD